MAPCSTKMPKMFLPLSPRVTLVSMITAQTAERTGMVLESLIDWGNSCAQVFMVRNNEK